jgi:hypothetical protein
MYILILANLPIHILKLKLLKLIPILSVSSFLNTILILIFSVMKMSTDPSKYWTPKPKPIPMNFMALKASNLETATTSVCIFSEKSIAFFKYQFQYNCHNLIQPRVVLLSLIKTTPSHQMRLQLGELKET